MDDLINVLQASPSLLLTVIIKFRLPHKLLGLRYSGILTFFVMLTVHIFAGWMNLHLHLATGLGGNTLYYGFMTFALYLFLFKDSLIKKLFFTVLITWGFPITFYIFLPFVHYFWGQSTPLLLFVLKVLEYVNTLLCAVGMEYIGRKFQNLRRELPVGYTIYLTAVILFVYVAIYSAYDQMLMINNAVVSLTSALTMFGFALSGSVVVFVAIFAVDRQVNISLKEQLHNLQAENFKIRELEWRKFSGFRHDIKNHLICLNNLLEQKKTEQAISYMSSLTNTVKQFDDPVQTGNEYADALLCVKYAEATAANIKLSLEMAIPPDGFIEPVDLCCILSNAFDNAIAACGHLTDGDKWITARAFTKQGQLVITVKNSKPHFVTVINGEVFPKKITADHGLGLDTVNAVVEKYGGILNLSADDAFSFSVLLPHPRL